MIDLSSELDQRLNSMETVADVNQGQSQTCPLPFQLFFPLLIIMQQIHVCLSPEGKKDCYWAFAVLHFWYSFILVLPRQFPSIPVSLHMFLNNIFQYKWHLWIQNHGLYREVWLRTAWNRTNWGEYFLKFIGRLQYYDTEPWWPPTSILTCLWIATQK